MTNIEERLNWRNYVVPKFARAIPVYNWYTFPHSYSRELVHGLLAEFNVKGEDVIWDPFVGAGTTLLACREKGIRAFGTDELPFSVFVSNVKVADYNASELEKTLNGLVFPEVNETAFATVPLIDDAFSPKVNLKVSSVYREILTLPESQQGFFLLALLAILESVSNTAKSGGWVKIENHEVSVESVIPLFQSQARKMIAGFNDLHLPPNNGKWFAEIGDARNFSDHAYKHVITSPPYLNRHDYTRVFALEMALHFVRTNKELIQLRYNAIRSHVEARPLSLFENDEIPLPEQVLTIVESVKQSCQDSDKKRVPSMIKGYFEDMFLTLRNISQRIEAGGMVAFVVGNVRFSGVLIPVDEILAIIGNQVGLTPLKIIAARYRGNSAQQMAVYGREPSRESIVVWQKTQFVNGPNEQND